MMRLKMFVSWCAFVRWKQMLARIVLWQTNRAERWPCRSQMQLMSRLKCISSIVCLAKTQNRWVERYIESELQSFIRKSSCGRLLRLPMVSLSFNARVLQKSREKPTTNRTHWFFNLSKALLIFFICQVWRMENRVFPIYQLIFQH